MKKIVLSGVAILAMVAILTGCGKKPQDKINAVLTGIDSAYAQGANIYLANEYTAIQDSMKSIMVDINTESAKRFKNYKPVEIKLDTMLLKVKQLKAKSIIKMVQAKKDADSLITSFQVIMDENVKLIVEASKVKKAKAVIENYKKEIKSLDSSLVENKSLFNKGLYIDVLNKINTSKANAVNLNVKLKAILIHGKGKRK